MSRGAAHQIRQARRSYQNNHDEFEIPTDEQFKAWSLDVYKKVKRTKRSPRIVRGLIRRECYKRDGFACTKYGSERELTLHHIIPKNQNGKFTPTNLKTLCRHCHNLTHKDEYHGRHKFKRN